MLVAMAFAIAESSRGQLHGDLAPPIDYGMLPHGAHSLSREHVETVQPQPNVVERVRDLHSPEPHYEHAGHQHHQPIHTDDALNQDTNPVMSTHPHLGSAIDVGPPATPQPEEQPEPHMSTHPHLASAIGVGPPVTPPPEEQHYEHHHSAEDSMPKPMSDPQPGADRGLRVEVRVLRVQQEDLVIPLILQPSYTLQKMCLLLSRSLAVAIQDIELLRGRQVLEGTMRNLADVGLTDGTQLIARIKHNNSTKATSGTIKLSIILDGSLNLQQQSAFISALPNDKVISLLNTLSAQIGVPASQLRLQFMAMTLHENNTIQESGLGNGTQMTASLKQGIDGEAQGSTESVQQQNVRILTHADLGLNGKAVVISVPADALVKHVKDAFSLEEGIPIEELSLAIDGIMTPDNMRLDKNQLQNALLEVRLNIQEERENESAPKTNTAVKSTASDDVLAEAIEAVIQDKVKQAEQEADLRKKAEIRMHDDATEVAQKNYELGEKAAQAIAEQRASELTTKQRELKEWWEQHKSKSPDDAKPSVDERQKAVQSAEEIMTKAREKQKGIHVGPKPDKHDMEHDL